MTFNVGYIVVGTGTWQGKDLKEKYDTIITKNPMIAKLTLKGLLKGKI